MTASNSSNLRAAALALVLVALSACAGQGEALPPLPNNPRLPPGVLFQEDFETGDEEWDTYDDGIVSYLIDSGQLVVTVNDVNASAWSALHYTLEDYVLDVETTQLAGPDDNGFGVLFRYLDPENHYRFDISSDGFYALSKVVDGTYETISPWSTHPAIQLGGQLNRVRVVALGGQYSFAVNDTPVDLCVGPGAIWDPASPGTCLGGEVLQSWQDTTFSGGQIALGVTAFQAPGPAIGFDNLTLSDAGTAP